MADWVEYINSDEDTPMTRLRRQNGRDKSWGVKYWAVGNENWGCGGDMTPEYYSDLYRRFAIYCRNYGENRLFKVACGASDYDYNWQEVVMQRVGRRMDGISLHYYTVKGWRGSKGSATVFDEAEYFRTIKKGLGIEEVLDKHMTTMDKYDPEKRIALVVDEWGTWFDVEPGTNPGFLYQQSTLRDAFVAANTLNLFNERCERIKMANIAQTVNVLQAIILTKDEKMILTPTYHVFDMYQVHQDATLLPSALTSVDYVFGDDKIPALNASCSRGSDGTINISIANAHPQKAIDLECELRGANVKTVSGRLLTAENLSTHNTFDKPDNVKPVTFKGASLTGQNLTVKMPARSIVVLQLK
jgi:alpha-N-arabinofuranosidase